MMVAEVRLALGSSKLAFLSVSNSSRSAHVSGDSDRRVNIAIPTLSLGSARSLAASFSNCIEARVCGATGAEFILASVETVEEDVVRLV